MVILDLKLKIVSQSISELSIDPETFTWIFIIECTQCKAVQPNEIYFTLKDEVEMTKGHGIANFMMSCKECKKGMSIVVYNAGKTTFSINCENGFDEGVLASFECRGCEIKNWIIKDGIILSALDSNTKFEDVDVSDLWMGYDEVQGVNCSLLEPVEITIEKQ